MTENVEARPTPEVRVVHEAAGWVVVADIDGERKQFGAAHSSEEEANFYATHMSSASDRWTGAAQKTDPDPEKYPGDGDPTRE